MARYKMTINTDAYSNGKRNYYERIKNNAREHQRGFKTMRKVKFLIDDNKYFINQFDGKPELQKHFKEKDSFQAVFTLYGCGKNIDRYTLTDYSGNKIDIDTLNGYQKGIILGDCYAYFEGRQYQDGATEPCGVINIEETKEEYKGE